MASKKKFTLHEINSGEELEETLMKTGVKSKPRPRGHRAHGPGEVCRRCGAPRGLERHVPFGPLARALGGAPPAGAPLGSVACA